MNDETIKEPQQFDLEYQEKTAKMPLFKNAQKQLIIALCLNIGHIMTGYTVAWSSPVVPKLQDIEQTPLPEVISVTQASWVGSSLNVGVIIGPYVAGFLSDKFGRKKTIMLGSLMMILGHAILVLAKNLATIFVGRFFGGFGVGMLTVVNLIYIGEMSSANIRGIILTSTGVFHTFGSLLVNSVGPYVPYQAIGYVIISVGAVHLLGCLYVPESPIFQLVKGREEESMATLRYLGRAKDSEELKTMMQGTKQTDEKDWQFSELFTNKTNRKSLLISLPVFIFQQTCGILAVLYFTTTIFQTAGSSVEPAIATIITGATQFIGTLFVPSLVENAGRKTLLLFSLAGCGASMCVMGVYFYLDVIGNTVVASIGWLPLVCMIVSFFSFSIGLNIIPNALLGEMFKSNIRSIGSSLVMTLGNIMGFATITSFGYIVEGLGSHVVFWMFTVVNVIGFIFVILVVPETKGLSLSEIEYMLGN